MVPHSILIRNYILPYFPKEPNIFHISLDINQYPLFSVFLILNLTKMFILTLLPMMTIFHLNNFNRTSSSYISKPSSFSYQNLPPSLIKTSLSKPTFIRAPHSPYSLRSLPSKSYNTSKPIISFSP